MSLQKLLDTSSLNEKKIGISEERIEAIKPVLRQYIAFWREYPDLFVDFMQNGGNDEMELTFKLYFYQRVFLRIVTRYKYVYAVYPRAFSKSFLAVLAQMIRCVLYPGARLFSTAGGKEQAASILQEKVDDICDKIPAFKREINWSRGKTLTGKDYCKYVFKNGSILDNLAARESTRGKRRHGGILEECVGIDQQILQEVLIPVMNVSRRCLDGTVQEDEVLNQSQIYITTAGYKGTFSYAKLIQTLVEMITTPEKAFIMGGTYRVPVLMKLLPKTFLNDLKRDPTFNEASFEREYCSHWTGNVEDAYFSGEKFDRNRILQKPEYEASGRSSVRAYYVLAVDVARSGKGCQSVVCIFKVTPQVQGSSIKSLVNLYAFEGQHFEDQAIFIKKLFYAYKARRVVIDGNGLGIGLMDYMVKAQVSADGEEYPPFGVMGGTYKEADTEYKKFRTPETEDDAIYVIKANAPINTEAYSAIQSQLISGKIKFLIDARAAKTKLMGTKLGQQMTPEQRDEYLLPYSLTDILREEMLNLRQDNEGVNIILKQANKNIKKDKFSALAYGIYYIREEEDSKKKRRRSMSEFMFMN